MVIDESSAISLISINRIKPDFLESLLFPWWKSAHFRGFYGFFALLGAIANP
jgi:hypothetical protein